MGGGGFNPLSFVDPFLGAVSGLAGGMFGGEEKKDDSSLAQAAAEAKAKKEAEEAAKKKKEELGEPEVIKSKRAYVTNKDRIASMNAVPDSVNSINEGFAGPINELSDSELGELLKKYRSKRKAVGFDQSKLFGLSSPINTAFKAFTPFAF